MKNLANCKPSEFLKQTVKIKREVEQWINITGIKEIRKNMPDISGETDAEKIREKFSKQAAENISKMFDAAMETHADQTLRLLALLCFVEPENVDDYPVKDYLGCFTEMLNCKEVIDFFILLVQLVQQNTLNVARA